MGRLSDEWKWDEIKPRPAKDREKAAKRIVSLPYEEAVKEMEKLHSEFNIGDYNDIGMRIMEKTKGNPDNYGVKVPVTEDIEDESKEEYLDYETAKKLLEEGRDVQWLSKYSEPGEWSTIDPRTSALASLRDMSAKLRINPENKEGKNPYWHKDSWGNPTLEEMPETDELLKGKEDVKDTIDTNDNGEIEVDEMADFQKSLDDYAAKNKKSREDIPARYRK